MDEFPATGHCDETAAVARVSLSGLSMTVLFASGMLFVLRESAPFAAPILVSLLLAYALEPVVDALARRRVPRAVAVFATYALLAIALAGGAHLARRQAVAFLDDLPATIAAIKDSAVGNAGGGRSAPPNAIQNIQRAAASLEATVNRAASPAGTRGARVAIDEPLDIRAYLLGAWTRVVSTTAQAIVIGVLTFVVLIGGDRIKTKLVEIAGPRFDRQILTIDVIRLIDRQIQRYLVARAAISLIVAGATAAAMWFLGVRQPLVLG
ncbi:MAG TPA: AI-2E family transporter, partial [Vicinamibacterales bacterium]|nr:AI-2E family transporter [Vicinamibacterales bacterium]